MSFMNKVKSGLTEAGSKAKTVVEINKLKSQNSSKQKEIEQRFQHIGRTYYLQETGKLSDGEGHDPALMIVDIARLEAEIEENVKAIKSLANEKDCVCGKPAPLESRFCPSCGHTFQ